MDAVSLGSDVQSTRLGFGCAALLSGKTPKQSTRLLEAAFDAGIRHFDIARVYGTGDAEAVLGRFAASRRDEVVLATKFGISPLPPTASVSVAKGIVRSFTRRSAFAKRLVQRYASRSATGSRFDVASMRESLATSLDQLQSDRVDLFLLHDCAAQDWNVPVLLDALASEQEDGRIRAFGPSSDQGVIRAILDSEDVPAPAVVQFNHDGLESHAASIHGPGCVTYRSLGRLGSLSRRLSDTELAMTWSGRLDLDVSRPGVLAGLLLASALQANPGGVVLFSASTPERIAENARVATERPYPSDQLRLFTELARASG